MGIFPSGSWFLEPEFPDPLTWLDRLHGIPSSSGFTRCLAEIRRLSAIITVLSLPAMPSESEDDDDDEEQDELLEETPSVIKVERANTSKKGETSAGLKSEENKVRVSDLSSLSIGKVA